MGASPLDKNLCHGVNSTSRRLLTSKSAQISPQASRLFRDQIWRDALPGPAHPALYFYREKGCWDIRVSTKVDPDYETDTEAFELEFHTDRLKHDNQLDLPLVSVDREARRVGLAWLREQDIKIRLDEDRRPIFTRTFDPEVDALYIPREKWREFCLEPSDLTFEPDMRGQSVNPISILTKIAVPEVLFLQSETISWMPGLGRYFKHLRILLVVLGPQPSIDGIPGPWSWEMEEIDGAWFSWNKETQDFDFHGGEGKASKYNALYQRLGEAARKQLREDLFYCRLDQFEIRPVLAVKR